MQLQDFRTKLFLIVELTSIEYSLTGFYQYLNVLKLITHLNFINQESQIFQMNIHV